MEDAQGTLIDLGGPAAPQAVARVLVDVDLPHLDHPLDYAVPAELADTAGPGRLVRVRLGGAKHLGWIVARADSSEHPGRLQPLLSVASDTEVVSPELLRLARYIADRTVSTASQVLSLAVPDRHAATERKVLAEPDPALTRPEAPAGTSWDSHPGGGALLRRLAAGESPRAVWTALAPTRDAQLADAVAAALSSGRSVVVTAPTSAQAGAVADMLAGVLGESAVSVTAADLPAAQRYRVHLEALSGRARLVVGTRSAVWAPVRDLGLVVVWDDGDDRLQEQRAPRVSALDVAVARAHLEGAGLIAGAFSRSVKAQALVRSGWAASLAPERPALRASTPRVAVPDELDREREGPAGASRLPPRAQQALRRELGHGPVLIQVPSAGYVPVVSCDRCRRVARCAHCGGTLSLGPDRTVRCAWCGRGTQEWRCPQCAGTRLRAVRVGSERTGEELGRAFPGVPLTVSSSTREITRSIGAEPRLVVATPGAEPRAEDGYAAALILDAPAIAGRPELWAPEEALRRWLNALSLVRAGAPALVLGGLDPVLSQALVRWDPAGLADRLLDEREALGFFPATTIVALDGPAPDVEEIAAGSGGELMGIVPRSGPQPGGATGEGKEEATPEVRALVRVAHGDAPGLLGALARIQQHRAAHRLPMVRITVNPPELF
ncbi:primosomal protein N' [Schaalia naturae]|uniref:Probable replication restart protein PriA n=1 Tax=Schaalia naturae TaxID=635203 RepID=A0ABW2SJU4_9ACTO